MEGFIQGSFSVLGRQTQQEKSSVRQREITGPLWVHDCQNPPRVQAGLALQRARGKQYGDGVEELPCQKLLRDRSSLLNFLKLCGRQKDLSKGSRLHADIEERGLVPKDIIISTALVRMYANCGALRKAQEVFDKLLEKDVVTWNTLITGYVQYGLGHEALNCFRGMRDEGISPDAFTFTCILKACSGIGSFKIGEEIHNQISKQGLLDKDVVLGSALVDMYAKCGMPQKAQEAFDELQVRNVVTWNSMIDCYAQHGLGDQALQCFRQMQDDGFSPNAVTFTCILKACGSIGLAKEGEKIHNEVRKLGWLKKDVVLGSALMDMYAKCGAIRKAQEVFDELPFPDIFCWNVLIAGYAKCGMLERARKVFDELRVRDIVSWNALLAGYVQHRLDDEALNCFRQMQDDGFCPNIVTFTCILGACSSIGSFEKGEQIHCGIIKSGLLEKCAVLGNALLDMYVKCGALGKAEKVFDELPDRDAGSWSLMITGYVEYGHPREALSCFKWMQGNGHSPDALTFASVLNACSSIGSIKEGEEIHDEVVKLGLLGKSVLLGSALVDMYAKYGILDKAQEVFDELPVQNASSWNALIVGYAKHGFDYEVLNCFRLMQANGISPDAATFVSILKACSSVGLLEEGKEIHDEIRRLGLLKKDNVLGSALVDMYGKCGMLEKAQEVFDELSIQDVISWSALVAGYTQNGFDIEALTSFRRMRDKGLSPDVVTFTCILKACGNTGSSVKGEEIHEEVRKLGLLKKDAILGSALLDMYVKCGMLSKAQEVFEELPEWNVISWTLLMSVYAQLGEAKIVFYLFRKMKAAGIIADATTFLVLLTACSHAGLLVEGQMLYDDMITIYRLTPRSEHYTCMVDLFCRAEHLDKALAFIEEVPCSDRPQLWLAFLSACRKLVNVELGTWAFEQAIQVDEQCAAAYTCMCNLYAVAGMEQEPKVEV